METPSEITNTTARDDSFELGAWWGRRQAFGAIASRCSAADVECLRNIRDQKLYQAKTADWEQFCREWVGVTRVYADRLIRCLETYGPNFFRLRSMVRLSPQTYRQISHAVTDAGITVEGQTIALEPENSRRIVEAVNLLRSQSGAPEIGRPSSERSSVSRRLASFEKRIDALLRDFNALSETDLTEDDRLRLARLALLARLELESVL